MDVLADVLQTIRLSTTTYFCSDFAAPWGLDIGAGQVGLFHAVIAGRCWLTMPGRREPIELVAGDIIAFPTGGEHRISDVGQQRMLPSSVVVEKVQTGQNPFEGQNTDITLLCGSFEYDTSISHPFLKDLPCFIHIRSQESEVVWLSPFMSVLANESQFPKPGSQVLVDRLSEILFVQLMRTYMAQAPENMRYMRALTDSTIGNALDKIHRDDRAHWNVERLAERSAMSRSSFSEKFTRAVGVSPKSYLIDWRMQKAKVQLQTTQLHMFTISERAGYSSEAAFGKAFKNYFGVSPGAIRKAVE